MSVALVLCLLVAGTLVAVVASGHHSRARRRSAPVQRQPSWDPGRDLRAERKARQLLRSVVSPSDYAMYEALGFITVRGAAASGGGDSGYAYLVYPHRPIVAYDTDSLQPLSEYCVGFPDLSDPALGERLPDADDVLAKWMSLRARERELIAEANMNLPGRQVDPGQVRRDLIRLREWRAIKARAAA